MDDDSLNSHHSPETEWKPRATPATGNKSGERRQQSRLGTPTAENQPLPCPRCSSSNTKFCYYNNYNLSQPRHFCKACRRYWTRGGTLRNVPVGGGTRKSSSSSSNKRSRGNAGGRDGDDVRMIKAHVPEPAAKNPNPVRRIGSDPETANSLKVNDDASAAEKLGNFNSWRSTVGLGTLDGYGVGFGFGSGSGPNIGYEHGLFSWPIEQLSIGVEGGGGALVSGKSTVGSNLQVDASGRDDGECEYFSLPEQSTATPADARK